MKRKGIYLSFILILVGLALSIELTRIFYNLRDPTLIGYSSFCAISEGINCDTVAASRYSQFLGIPVSVYGIVFYLILFSLVLVGQWGSKKGYHLLSHWPIYLFWLSAFSVLLSILLAYIAYFKIQSICILCSGVHLTNITLFILSSQLNHFNIKRLIKNTLSDARWYFQSAERSIILILLIFNIGVTLIYTSVRSSSSLPPPLRLCPSEHDAQLTSSIKLSKGPDDAPIRIIEFNDYNCPYCSKAHQVLEEVVSSYPGKIRIMHRDFPLDNTCNPHIARPFHRYSCQAAVFARCAARQGKFWPYNDLLFKNFRDLTTEKLMALAKELELELSCLTDCLNDPSIMEEIQQDIELAHSLGINATPTFFINGKMVVGDIPLEKWVEIIEHFIGSVKKEEDRELNKR